MCIEIVKGPVILSVIYNFLKNEFTFVLKIIILFYIFHSHCGVLGIRGMCKRFGPIAGDVLIHLTLEQNGIVQ